MTKSAWRSLFALALLMAILALSYVRPLTAQGDSLSDGAGLSPYWRPVVSRWEGIAVRYAEMRGLDPDLVASVIWKESRGDATVTGVTGAIGLMCVKPFPWRPSAEELRNPWTNVAAGTKTLAQVIRDGNGDVYYALAAYNGGWDQIHLRITRRYAADVLGDYVRAIAVEHGLPAEGDWLAVLSVDGLPDQTTVTVLGPGRPVARYTARPWSRADVPTVPTGRSPEATVMTFEDEQGREVDVNLWFIQDGSGLAVSSESLTGRLPANRTIAQFHGGLLD